jgi:hypothetical protein
MLKNYYFAFYYYFYYDVYYFDDSLLLKMNPIDFVDKKIKLNIFMSIFRRSIFKRREKKNNNLKEMKFQEHIIITKK